MADRKLKSPAAAPKAAAKVKRPAVLERKTLVRVSYQGEPGANSHLACREVYPDLEPVACATFEDALAAVKSGDARYAMIPIENSVAGRVADIHHLLPGGRPVDRRRALPARAPPADGAARRVAADRQARALPYAGARPVPQYAAQARARGHPRSRYRRLGPHRRRGQQHELAAIATTLAAEIYGLKILMHDIEDEKHNTTRFVVLVRRRRRTRKRATVRSSPPSSSACATCRRRSTRRWAALPPTAST